MKLILLILGFRNFTRIIAQKNDTAFSCHFFEIYLSNCFNKEKYIKNYLQIM
uniref:Hypothetical secreted peptide n=1 Tax=Glossina morsitans morsitans TaxID=37546 RepID=D3TSS7_GLOMM